MTKRETSHRERIEMIQAKLDGKSLKQIAAESGLHYYTVRHWWRQYRDQGWSGLKPRPRQRPVRGPLSSFDPLVRYVALRLKREHPKWGPDLLLFKLSRCRSLKGKRLPGRSAVAAYVKPYLARIQERRRITLKRPGKPRVAVQAPHECWQMDFKGDENLGACGKQAPFMVVDNYTSAPLETRLYPAGLKGVSTRTVQQDLRHIFAEWGLPDFIQMDRGAVFVGSTRLEWPSVLLLWLVGMGVMPIINDAGRPTQNAQVERQNQTWQHHVAIGANFATPQLAQQATDTARHERLTLLPSRNKACAGRPPLLARPDLCVPRRSFDPRRETELFDMERVELYLADWRWLRMVDKVGSISLANHNVYVSNIYRGQAVAVTYNLTQHCFEACAQDHPHTTLACFNLPVITPQYIIGLDRATAGGG